MMKKLMIVVTMFLLSIVIVNQSVYAESVFVIEPAANAGGLWHVEEGNRAYVFMRYTVGETVIETGNFPAGVKDYLFEYDEYASNPDNNDYSHFTYWPDFMADDLSFPNTVNTKEATISNPNPALYDTLKVEIISNMTSEYPGRGAPELKEIITYTNVVNDVTINLYDKDFLMSSCEFDYSFLKLSIDGDEILTNRNLSEAKAAVCLEQWGPFQYPAEANPYYDDLSFGVRIYWEKSDTAEVIDPGTSESPWEALPNTTGSPLTPLGDWGSVSNITVNNQIISFNVNYQGTSYPINSFSVEGNLDFIDESNNVLYYTDPINNDRILYFNFGETLDSAILAASSFAMVDQWNGEALWNLTQNEIKVTGVLTVYNYIPEVDVDGNVYSYFYMPNVEMDSLISVSSVLAYRYWDDGFLNIGDLEPGEIQYKAVAAVRGEVTSVNPTWVEDTYTTAYLAGGAIAIATATVSWIPVYGWGVAGAFFLAGGALQVSDINEWFAYDVEQIQHVIPSVALTNEINTYISETSSNDQFTADTDKLYKLHLATLQDYDDVQVMGDLSNVTQVVWETDGEIYVVNEVSILNPDWGGPGTYIPLDDIGNDDLELVMYVIIGVVGLYIFVKLVDKKPELLLLIGGAAVYVLYKLGMTPW